MKAFRLLLLIFVLCSCSQNKVVSDLIEIHIDPSKIEEAYDISNNVEPEWDIVALETTDECLISDINGIEYQNNRYYILDKAGSSVFIFDSTGKFISKLYKKGEGPDEYSEIDAFCVEGKNIWVSDGNMRWLICYDENLKMIDRFSIFEIMGAYDIKYRNGYLYLATNWSGWNEKNMQLATYNIQTKEITGLWYVPKISDEAAHWIKPTQLAQSGSSCLFIHSYCDTIFQIDDEGFVPKYKVIFSERYKDIPKPIEEYMDPNNKHIITGIENIKQTKNKIIIGYPDYEYLRSAIYDKVSGICNVYTVLVYSDLNNLEIYQNTTFFENNNVVSSYPAYMFLGFYEKETDRAKIQNESYRKKIESIVSSIDEYSNHVVIRFKIKPDSKL
ncbi:MAG: 6-bladed beta-propeller [Prevotellaceae bacterium]|nr:6-bladed beta-propeller [Prevotellaceae bacterium]